MTKDSDRRKNPRVSCQDIWLTVTVGEPSNNTANQQLPDRHVRVDNLSDSGICLISTDPFELAQIVYFSDPTLPTQGEVVWTCKSKIECKAGIHFKR
ncbi:MAG: PilZ domain-containing protein [Desulfobulbaceae bacterium]|nr:PilZ domain-containing protein [Desulfobulbaceae bacterium]